MPYADSSFYLMEYYGIDNASTRVNDNYFCLVGILHLQSSTLSISSLRLMYYRSMMEILLMVFLLYYIFLLMMIY